MIFMISDFERILFSVQVMAIYILQDILNFWQIFPAVRHTEAGETQTVLTCAFTQSSGKKLKYRHLF